MTTRQYDDLDSPDTAPGKCPECGQPANIWEAVSQHWECSHCMWKGRNPKPIQSQPDTLPR